MTVYLDDYDNDDRVNLSLWAGEWSNRFAIFETDMLEVTDPGKIPSLPVDERIGMPFPNPSNSQVNIVVEVRQSKPSTLTVFDITGRKAATLHVPASRGFHRIVWDSSTVTSGLYLMRWSEAPDVVRKVVIVK